MSRIHRALAGVLLVGLLALAACSSGPSANTNGGGSGKTPTTAPATATATAKPKPTSVPNITMAFCQSIMTVAQANQIMNSPLPATQIDISNPGNGGSCNWDHEQPLRIVAAALFMPYPGGVSLQTIAQQALSQAQADGKIPPGASVNITPISGVGDQAIYVAISGSEDGITGYDYLVYTTYGSVYISCFQYVIDSQPPASLQGPLTQVCQRAVAQL